MVDVGEEGEAAVTMRMPSVRALVRAACVGLLCGLLVGGCADSSARERVVVFAAMSTRDALRELETEYERGGGVDVVLNFGSSGDLARQIVAGAKADIFLSADEVAMDEVERRGLLSVGSRRELLGNELVVIVPEDASAIPSQPFEPEDLARSTVRRIALADPRSVPAGRYARSWLESRGLWSVVEARIVPTVDVRAVLAAVEAGAADAGIVYASDLRAARAVRVVWRVPFGEGPRIAYPIAALKTASGAAGSFVEFLSASTARAIFERHGFAPPPIVDAGVGRVPEGTK